MKNNFKLLHIASFTGNIGDNASHNGLYNLLTNYLDLDFSVTELEIRKAYLNYKENDKLSWDKELIDKINSHNLTVIGGGGYFTPWIEDSHTGTTIDMPFDLIKLINSPVIFYSLGFDPYIKKYSDNTLRKFGNFIDEIFKNPNCLVAVRNDGSKKSLTELISCKAVEKIDNVPDSAFFMKSKGKILEQFLDCKYVAINLAKDMIENRFKFGFSYNNYLRELVKWLKWMGGEYSDFKFVFVPHIYSDIEAINDLFKLLPDMFIREKIIVTPYVQNKHSEDVSYVYKNAQLSVGSRLHANVISISSNTPSIALVTHNKVGYLYDELGLSDRSVVANKGSFNEKLVKLTNVTLKNRQKVFDNYVQLNKELLLSVQLFLDKVGGLLSEK